MRFLLVLIMIVLFIGCTDESRSYKVLTESGYTDIQFTEHSYVDCGNNDFYHTGFRARDYRGKPIFGTVCCGLFSNGCAILER